MIISLSLYVCLACYGLGITLAAIVVLQNWQRDRAHRKNLQLPTKDSALRLSPSPANDLHVPCDGAFLNGQRRAHLRRAILLKLEQRFRS